MRALCATPCRCLCLGVFVHTTNRRPRRRTMRHASHSFFMDVRTCSRGASSSRRSSVVSRSFGRSGRRFARARLRRRLASRRARSATQYHRSREKRTFMVDSSSPSVARRSRRRVTRGAPIFDVARAVDIPSSASFVGARGTDRRPRRRRLRRMGEWATRMCFTARNISTTRCTTRRGSGELTR